MSLSAMHWARTQAPTSDAVDRLILLGIADNPSGETHHSIRVERLAKQVRITTPELRERVGDMRRSGLILVRESDQPPAIEGAEECIECILNLDMIEEGF